MIAVLMLIVTVWLFSCCRSVSAPSTISRGCETARLLNRAVCQRVPGLSGTGEIVEAVADSAYIHFVYPLDCLRTWQTGPYTLRIEGDISSNGRNASLGISLRW